MSIQQEPIEASGRGSREARPAFLITIDTEGDHLWSRPRDITVQNARSLPRFHELCEAYALRPTYLVNWEMANSDAFVEFGKDVLMRDTGEIGMHLHAWNSPPLTPLTDDDHRHQPYLMEYPAPLIREKVRVMTETLERTFGTRMISHRAGRWGLSEAYIRTLIDCGYLVDCSVTPHVDWRRDFGDPAGHGGPDFRRFPESAYLMDPDDMSRPGASLLLQVPMTVVSYGRTDWVETLAAGLRRVPFVGRYTHRIVPTSSWFRPDGRNGPELIRILSMARDERRDYVELMLHSSELMPGGSPRFPTPKHIEALFDDLTSVFDAARTDWVGRTLGEYREDHLATRQRNS